MLDNNEIEPAAAALATCCNANFVADRLQFVTEFVELFGWEWAAGECQSWFPARGASR